MYNNPNYGKNTTVKVVFFYEESMDNYYNNISYIYY